MKVTVLHEQEKSCLRSEVILLQFHAEAKRLQMLGCLPELVSLQTENFLSETSIEYFCNLLSIKTHKVSKSGSVLSGKSKNDKT